MTVKTKFKNSITEKRWIELHKEKTELLTKKKTTAIEDKLDTLNSLMSSCKIGFNLTEAKVKKTIKFLRQETGVKKVKYGTLPEDVKPKSILFKENVILYIEKDNQILFKENE